MKNKSLKNKLVAALLLAIAGHAGMASAFSMLGSKTKIRTTEIITPPPPPPGTSEFSHIGALGDMAGATDVWKVVCPATTTRLDVQVIDRNPVAAPLVSVQTIKGIKATNSTDPSDGDETYSPLVYIDGSVGTYYLLVDKTSADAELYTVDIICKQSATVPLTATSVTLTQDN